MSRSSVYAQIPILRASATGSTTLSAFHHALEAVDLGHYNLIRLSSVIPPSTTVDPTGKADVPSGDWGDQLYCVYAEQRTATPNEQAWAGIGWVHRLDDRGGYFVEHEGTAEQFVTAAIKSSLQDMIAGREHEYTAPDWVVTGILCTDKPVCSLVVAPYECLPWQGRTR